MTALMTAPCIVVMPSMAFMPSPAPAMLPMLNARPPNDTRTASSVPNPGRSVLATSWARCSATAITRQMLSCAPRSKSTETRIAKPKLAPSWLVKTAVCVRNPGPMALVAIKNAAPSSTLRRLDRVADNGVLLRAPASSV